MQLDIVAQNKQAVLQGINRRGQKIGKKITDARKDIGFLVQKWSKRYAPVKTHTLENSIQFETSDEYVRIFVPSNSFAGDYAKIRHDKKYRYGIGTLRKGAQAGRLFIKRAIKDQKQKIKKLIDRALKESAK